MVARIQPVEERRARAAYVQNTGGRGRKACDDRHRAQLPSAAARRRRTGAPFRMASTLRGVNHTKIGLNT